MKREQTISVRPHVLAASFAVACWSVLVWSQALTPPPGQPPGDVARTPPSIGAAAWSPDGERLATGSNDSTAKVWDLQTGKELVTLAGIHGSVLSIAWSPDGKQLATGSFDNTARVWDAETGKELLNLDVGPGPGPVWSVAWSPDGKRLATGSVGRSARVWDAATGKQLLSLNKCDVQAVAWSPDGKRLATGSTDYTAALWDAETGKRLINLSGRTGQVSDVAWSPDGKWLATASYDQAVKVWDTTTGKEVLALGRANGHIWRVAWSPDGKRLAVASDTTQLRNAESGKELLTLPGRGSVFTVAWSPDGKRLATGSVCNRTTVWNAESGEKLLTLDGLGAMHYGCAAVGAESRGSETLRLGRLVRIPRTEVQRLIDEGAIPVRPSEVSHHSPEPFEQAAKDPELAALARRASERRNTLSFLRTVGEARLIACSLHYALLLPLLTELKCRYPGGWERQPMPCPRDPSRTDITGRAQAGSQRQIQTYVNERTSELCHAIAMALQACKLDESKIRWVSPLAADDYCEY